MINQGSYGHPEVTKDLKSVKTVTDKPFQTLIQNKRIMYRKVYMSSLSEAKDLGTLAGVSDNPFQTLFTRLCHLERSRKI
jgi:hypothetical protein